ncbi:MAG: hypothetical protein R3E68_04055 [Burkholderiaceae bacterium]
MIVADRKVNVRDALPADLDNVVDLARMVQRMFPMGENLDYLAGAEGRALLQYHIEKGWFRLAELEGQLVGGAATPFATAGPSRTFSAMPSFA